MTSMPPSGFLISCAIVAAISPSAARRSRSRSRSSICSTCVRSLKNSAAPIGLVVLVANERQGVADDLVGRLQAQFGAVGQGRQLERAAEHADDVGVAAEHVGERLAQVVEVGGQAENAAGFVVDQHERAGAVDGQHAVAHVGDHVAEEVVGRAASAALGCRTRLYGATRGEEPCDVTGPGAASQTPYLIRGAGRDDSKVLRLQKSDYGAVVGE